MIFITGDIHGDRDINRLSNKRFPQNKELSKSDYLIIVGDFGCVWDGSRQDLYWLNWLKRRNFTTLFVDGNHENFDLLYSYPVSEWNGGKVHFINESVIHLMRGQVYKVNGLRLFCFGGAHSEDRAYRKEGKSWWRLEMPTPEEYEEGLLNLSKNDWNVDYIITHTAPSSILDIINEKFNRDRVKTEINDYFEELKTKVKFRRWFSGHDHLDEIINERHAVIYNKIIRIC